MKNVNMLFLLSVALFFNMTGCSKNDGSAELPVDDEFSGILLYDIQPDFEHGIVIIDTEGQVKHHLPMVNNTKLTLGEEVV